LEKKQRYSKLGFFLEIQENNFFLSPT
jgi:hypothetical protein